MKRNILLAGIAMAACLLTGCSETADKFDKNGNSWSQGLLGARLEGSSNYVSKEFNVRDFDKVVVVGPMDVDYTLVRADAVRLGRRGGERAGLQGRPGGRAEWLGRH